MDLHRREFGAIILGAAAGLSATGTASAQADPLRAWNDGPAKEAILKFVREATDSSSPNFVPPEERIAEFDQDGTLWVEHPVYSQVVYCLEHVGSLVKEKPELREREPFEAVLSGELDAIAKLSMREIFEIALATQSGMRWRSSATTCANGSPRPGIRVGTAPTSISSINR